MYEFRLSVTLKSKAIVPAQVETYIDGHTIAKTGMMSSKVQDIVDNFVVAPTLGKVLIPKGFKAILTQWNTTRKDVRFAAVWDPTHKEDTRNVAAAMARP